MKLPTGYKTGTMTGEPLNANGTLNAGFAPGWSNASQTTLDTHYLYDASGNVVRTTDPDGVQSYAYYDKLGRKTVQVDGEKYTHKWEYNSEGNVTRETLFATPLGSVPVVGTVPTAASHANDRITTYIYDKSGNRLEETRENVVVHNGSGGNQNTVDATVKYTYNGLGQVLTKSEATGDDIQYSYDDGGRLIQEQREAFLDQTGAWVSPASAYTYDGLGNLVRTTASGSANAAARVSTYQYGSGGLLARQTDAANNFHEYFYDQLGRQILDRYQRTEANGTTTHTEGVLTSFDALGRVTEQTVASLVGGVWNKGDITSTAYNAFGDAIAIGINKAGSASSTWQQQNKYDRAGRLWATNIGDGVWKYFGYDKNGNQTIAVTSAGENFGNIQSAGKLFFSLADFTGEDAVSQTDVNATYTVYNARNLAVHVVEEDRQLSATSTPDLVTSPPIQCLRRGFE